MCVCVLGLTERENLQRKTESTASARLNASFIRITRNNYIAHFSDTHRKRERERSKYGATFVSCCCVCVCGDLHSMHGTRVHHVVSLQRSSNDTQQIRLPVLFFFQQELGCLLVLMRCHWIPAWMNRQID